MRRRTPNEVGTRLQNALCKVLAQKELGATIAARGVAIEFMKADAVRWQKVAKYAGITLD